MKVTDVTRIEGRGPAVVIDALPPILHAGMRVRRLGSLDPVWDVRGIETDALPRSHVNGQPALLLLGEADPLPAVGDELASDGEPTGWADFENGHSVLGLEGLTLSVYFTRHEGWHVACPELGIRRTRLHARALPDAKSEAVAAVEARVQRLVACATRARAITGKDA